MDGTEERERSRLRLQEQLDAAKTQAQRNRVGQFSTPPQLAREILRCALSFLPSGASVRFLEPGFGTGPFYSALLHAVSPSRIESAVGYELDPHYGEAAKKLWKRTGLRLHIGDFTKTDPPMPEDTRFNLVVCNPPYVRHHHLGQAKKRELLAAVGRHVGFEMNGLSGLYTYFLVLSKAWTAKDGVGAWLIPSEFMDVNYGRKVKQFLLNQVTLCRIHRFNPHDVQFGDALVSSAVVFLQNAPPPKDHKVEFSFGGSVAAPVRSQLVSVGELRHLPKWTGLPMSSRPRRRRNGKTLADLFAIKRGLATGCNEFFVLRPEQIAQRNLPTEFITPILPSPRNLETDEILADDEGNPRIANRLFLLNCDLPQEEVQENYPALWRYFQHGMEASVHARYLCRHRDPWYSQENRAPAPFLCTYMGRASQRTDAPFRFILNHSKATAANVYLMLYPKGPLGAVLNGDLEVSRVLWQALSLITAEMLTQEGRVYGGGLHKLEPRELGNVPADSILEGLSNARGFRMDTQLDLFDG